MDPFKQHQAPKPQWTQPVEPADQSSVYLRRIAELEQQVKTYEELLDELPNLFERKFQQRLEPLIERCRLLSEQLEQVSIGRPQPTLSGSSEPDNVVRLPGLRLPKLLQKWQRSA